jgi:hypothetical protein
LRLLLLHPLSGAIEKMESDQVRAGASYRSHTRFDENRILRADLPARLRLSDPERCTLAEIGKRLVGRKALKKVDCMVKPDILLAWGRRLIACKFDSSQCRTHPGRPRISAVAEDLVVRLARENAGGGYYSAISPENYKLGSPESSCGLY